MLNRALVAGLLPALLLCACAPKAPGPAATAATAAPPASAAPTETASPAAERTGIATIDNIAPHARIASPVHIVGSAPADWYFENSFPATVTDVYGEKLGEAPAKPEVNWTEPDPVKKFETVVRFKTPVEQEGWIVLYEDMPGQDENGDDKPARSIKIPVILVPEQ